MQLSETKTYRTRDGSRTGIRVRDIGDKLWSAVVPTATSIFNSWWEDGRTSLREDGPNDLIEEPHFSYSACPTGPDGRKRAVTRRGREVVLLADDVPGDYPLVGWTIHERDGVEIETWTASGVYCEGSDGSMDLLVPPPPKRVVWVNPLPIGISYSGGATTFASEEEADKHFSANIRLGNRAYRIEIDP